MVQIDLTEKLTDILDNSKLLIFDYDGTMFDSEPLHYTAHSETVLKFLGIEMSYELYKNAYSGRKAFDIMKSEIERANLCGLLSNSAYSSLIKEESIENLALIRNSLANKLIHERNVQLNPFIIAIIEKYGEAKEFKILSAERELTIRDSLVNWGISHLFTDVVSTSDLHTSKGDILDKWLNEYNDLKREEIVFFEDVEINLALGKERKIKTIGIEHDVNKGKLFSYDYLIV